MSRLSAPDNPLGGAEPSLIDSRGYFTLPKTDSNRSRAALPGTRRMPMLSPSAINSSFASVYPDHRGKPGPYGLPVLANRTIYAAIIADSLRSAASNGR